MNYIEHKILTRQVIFEKFDGDVLVSDGAIGGNLISKNDDRYMHNHYLIDMEDRLNDTALWIKKNNDFSDLPF